MKRDKKKTSKPSMEHLLSFEDNNVIASDDLDLVNNWAFIDNEDDFFFSNESEEYSELEENDFEIEDENSKNNFVFEDQRYENAFSDDPFRSSNKLFVFEGKNDYLFIGLFFLLVAFFLIGGFYLNPY